MSGDGLGALPVELPSGMSRPRGRRGRRGSVSAESDRPVGRVSAARKVIPKSEEAIGHIRQAVSKSFLFANVDEEQLKQVMDAMEEKRVAPGDCVIQEGDDGDYFYVVQEGKFDVWKTPSANDEEGAAAGSEEKAELNSAGQAKVFQYDEGGSFGELALMYNCPRAASVIATSDGVLWAVDRVTFRSIIIEGTQRRRQLHEQFLENVPILTKLSKGERSRVADCLNLDKLDEGTIIINEGDNGDRFYFVEAGECRATQAVGDQNVEVNVIGAGGFFGERALIMQEPRAATVVASKGDPDSDGKVHVAWMDRSAFERLLGPIRDILERAISEYESGESILAKQESG